MGAGADAGVRGRVGQTCEECLETIICLITADCSQDLKRSIKDAKSLVAGVDFSIVCGTLQGKQPNENVGYTLYK